MPSFDVVSQVDLQEVDNAVNQAAREISTRYDFRDTQTEITWNPTDSTIVIVSSAEGRITAALDVLQSKCLRRSIALETLAAGDIRPTGGGHVRMDIVVQQGIETATAKQIAKDIKTMGLKVQAAIQGDQLRVTGKKRDALQEVIAELRAGDYGLPLQFINFRD